MLKWLCRVTPRRLGLPSPKAGISTGVLVQSFSHALFNLKNLLTYYQVGGGTSLKVSDCVHTSRLVLQCQLTFCDKRPFHTNINRT